MPASQNFGDNVSSSSHTQQSLYDVMGVSPQSSQAEIRDAYRRKSKQYHPDLALIDKAEAATKFQALNQAYDTLRFPDKRKQYDQRLAISTPQVKRRATYSTKTSTRTTTAFLESEDRPLSAGEIFALFVLGLTFLFCLLLAVGLGVARGEVLLRGIPQTSSIHHQIESIKARPKGVIHRQKGENDRVKHDLDIARNTTEKKTSSPTPLAKQRPLFPPM